MHLHGNLIEYRKGLILRYGEEYVEDIELNNTPKKYSIPEIIELKVVFKDKLNKIKG